MLRKRGRPGAAEHTALRARQRRDAARPSHHTLARVISTRLAHLAQDTGIADIETIVRPVDADEATTADVPAGWPMPAAITRVVRRATAGTLEDLVDLGAVGSAEVLARLTPQIAATTAAAAYGEPACER